MGVCICVCVFMCMCAHQCGLMHVTAHILSSDNSFFGSGSVLLPFGSLTLKSSHHAWLIMLGCIRHYSLSCLDSLTLTGHVGVSLYCLSILPGISFPRERG